MFACLCHVYMFIYMFYSFVRWNHNCAGEGESFTNPLSFPVGSRVVKLVRECDVNESGENLRDAD